MTRDDVDAGSYQVPAGLDLERREVRWLPSDGARFTEPFFEDTVRRLRRTSEGRRLVSTSLDAWSVPAPGLPPVTIVLHISRCGSTLVSQMLASLPRCLVVSEAPVFNDILRGRRGDRTITYALRDTWLAHAVSAFAASQADPPADVVLKLDCWHIFEIARLRRVFPHAPLIFVYRDPLEVLVSLTRRPSLTLVRDTVLPEEIGLTRDARDALSPVEHAAAILGAFLREALRHRADLVPLPYESLPSGVWDARVGMSFDDDDIACLKRAAAHDAKQPGVRFVPDAERKREDASAEVRDACARWSSPAYERWRAAI